VSATGDDGPFEQVVGGDSGLGNAFAALRSEVESLQRLEPLFVEGTAVLRLELQSLRTELAAIPAGATGAGSGAGVGGAASDLPGLRSELRTTLREATEHLRTLLVEEVNELRGELQGVRARLSDRRSEDRADLRTSLAAGSDTLRAALAEDAAGLRAEIEAVRAQLKEQQVADQQLLRAELRAALREWNEHLRTRIVEEATELRSELHQVRGQLADQQTQHRSDLKAALGEGSGQVLAALTEATAALRTEVAFLRDRLATREMVAGALGQSEQVSSALSAELEQLRADVRAVPPQIEEQRAATQVDTRAAVYEGAQVAEAAFAHHAAQLVVEIQDVLSKHEERHGDEGRHLRAIVTARTESLRAALLSETAAARDALVEQSERLRTEIQAVWSQLNDQHADERSELGRALVDGTDFVRAALRRELEAIGTGLAASQAAAQDELASLRGRVEAFSALFGTAQTAARTDLADVRMQLDALGMDLAGVQAAARDDAAAVRETVASEVERLRVRLDKVAADTAVDLNPLREQLEALAADMPARQAAAQDEVRSAVAAEIESLRAAVEEQLAGARAGLTDEAAASRTSLVERFDHLRAEVQAVWGELNDQHRDEREQLERALHENGEQARASVLVELTEVVERQAAELARVGEAQHERVVAEVTIAAERLSGLQGQLEAFCLQVADERGGEVEALLAAVGGNEERLHELVSTELAAGREEARTEFKTAAEERQARLVYLEAALQTFNQALALEREEMRALITWSQEATDAAVSELGGRLDALARMLARLMAGEGMMEVTEAVAALRTDLARINRKLPARPAKAAPAEGTPPAKRLSRSTPPSRTRRPS